VRWSDDKAETRVRARKAVAAWRDQHPDGTYHQLVADLGPDFSDEYGTVLRSMLFVIERHEANILTGVPIVTDGIR
jgi:hypothetical protein